MYDIFKISECENEMIKEAEINYGTVFRNTNKLLSLLPAIYDELNPEFLYFYSLIGVATNSLYLSFLSIVRKHLIQTDLMIRHALESSALACYAAVEPSINEDGSSVFGKLNDDGLYETNEGIKKIAYDWLEKNYKEYSDSMKKIKDRINTHSSHANIMNVYFRSDSSEMGRYKEHFFDDYASDNHKFRFMIKHRIILIGNIGSMLKF